MLTAGNCDVLIGRGGLSRPAWFLLPMEPMRAAHFLRPALHRCVAVLSLGVFLHSSVRVQATGIPVVDIGANVQLARTEIDNGLRHLEDIAKYIQQVDNQLEQLRRMGDPNTYVQMLQLNRLVNDIGSISQGIQKGVVEVEMAADGPRALQYTANGIYRDLSQIPDKLGNAVKWNTAQFKQFDTVAQLSGQYQLDVTKYNTTMASLGSQFQALLKSLNAAGSQTESQKIIGQMHAVSAQMTAAGQILHASADRMGVQTQLNQQMAARDAQAQQQIDAQNAQNEVQSMQNQLISKYSN